jgi:UDP-N-acetylglucosamine--N-acetylmuramyl-(pentapeptide) pyrophosphoryl-undecaprenol N-acetylglucosamine transferase
MFPAQALAEAMLAAAGGWRCQTDARGARYAGGFPEAVEITQDRLGHLRARRALAKALVPFASWRGVSARSCGCGATGRRWWRALAATRRSRRWRRRWAAGLPRMIHEQNGVPGRVNRVFARRVDVVACGTWPTELPEGVGAIHTGNPVRGRSGKARRRPTSRRATTRCRCWSSAAARARGSWPTPCPRPSPRCPTPIRRRLRVAQQARPEDVDRVAPPMPPPASAEVAPFFRRHPRPHAEAQLVIAAPAPRRSPISR